MRINSLKFTVLILASHLKGVKRISNKNLTINERNLTSTQWVEYHVGTKHKSYNTLPTSNITAEAVTVDSFTLSQTNNAGVTTTNGRSYTATGMIQNRTDSRDNTTTTVTDAQGNTSCCRYDVRGRKLAEWGTGIQPVLFGYDDADRMTALTTFRASTETLSPNPCDRTDGDTTTWSYHNASGMETSKTYADNSSVVKTYDAYNRVLTETDARGKVKAHTYEPARGLLLGTTYSDSTSPRTYTYNHLGQPTQVTDAAGVRTLSYNAYGDVTESGSTWQPIQWSSEYNDAALGLVYYNYRHYNPIDGRWIGRDRLELSNQNTYNFTCMPIYIVDILGEKLEKINADDISKSRNWKQSTSRRKNKLQN